METNVLLLPRIVKLKKTSRVGDSSLIEFVSEFMWLGRGESSVIFRHKKVGGSEEPCEHLTTVNILFDSILLTPTTVVLRQGVLRDADQEWFEWVGRGWQNRVYIVNSVRGKSP